MKRLLFISIIMFSAISVSAQQDTVRVLVPRDTTGVVAEDIRVVVPIERWNSLEQERHGYIATIDELSEANDTLRAKYEIFSDNIKQLANREEVYLSRIHELEQEVKRYEGSKAHIDRADTLVIKNILSYLGAKEMCTVVQISELRRNYSEIINPQIKNEYQGLDRILSIYTDTYNTIVELANEELTIKRIASETSDVRRDRFIREYKDKLSVLQYVQEFYRNEYDYSEYLNQLLDLTYEALETENMDVLLQVVELAKAE